MKSFFSSRQRMLALLLAAAPFFGLFCGLLFAPAVRAQSPPGWGWVARLGTYVPNTDGRNEVAGLGRDAAGNLYLLGTFAGQPPLLGSPPGSPGGSDIFLTKYSPNGVRLWQRTLQSSGDDAATALVVDPSGRCILAGYYGGKTGDNLSFSSFNNTTAPLAGPALLGLAAPGGYYSNVPFMAAVDASGALLWATNPSPTYGGMNVAALHLDSQGNCYVSANTSPRAQLIVNGQNYPPIGTYDAVLVKYTAAGQVAWVRRVGVIGNGSAYSAEIKTDNEDAVYWLLGHSGTITVDQVTVGVTSPAGNYGIVKLSAGNRVKWIKNNLLRVGNISVFSQLLAFDGASNALYLSGSSTGAPITFTGNSGPVQVQAEPNALTSFVAQCDTAGQVQWVKRVSFSTNVPGGLPGPRGAGITGFTARGSGFTLLTRTVDFNATTFYGSAKVYGLAEGGLPCAVQFNTTTNQVDWVRVGGTPSALQQASGSEAKGVAFDAAGNVFVAGSFTGTAQFGTTTLTTASAFQPEIFLAKLDQTILTAAQAGGAGQPWRVYPNPATGTVQLAGLPALAQVRVYDAQGRLARELPAVRTADAPRSLGGLAPGLYLLQVANTTAPYQSQRLVVE